MLPLTAVIQANRQLPGLHQLNLWHLNTRIIRYILTVAGGHPVPQRLKAAHMLNHRWLHQHHSVMFRPQVDRSDSIPMSKLFIMSNWFLSFLRLAVVVSSYINVKFLSDSYELEIESHSFHRVFNIVATERLQLLPCTHPGPERNFVPVAESSTLQSWFFSNVHLLSLLPASSNYFITFSKTTSLLILFHNTCSLVPERTFCPN